MPLRKGINTFVSKAILNLYACRFVKDIYYWLSLLSSLSPIQLYSGFYLSDHVTFVCIFDEKFSYNRFRVCGKPKTRIWLTCVNKQRSSRKSLFHFRLIMLWGFAPIIAFHLKLYAIYRMFGVKFYFENSNVFIVYWLFFLLPFLCGAAVIRSTVTVSFSRNSIPRLMPKQTEQ